MLSPHFDLPEFQKDAPIPEECIPVLTEFCTLVLEPVREQFGPIYITSGYRPPEANADAHGQPNSHHIYTADICAADFYSTTSSARDIFDWMRSIAGEALPFCQLILEHGANGSSIVHVSRDRTRPGFRSVLEGATHNSEPYIRADFVPYNPTVLPLGVEESTT